MCARLLILPVLALPMFLLSGCGLFDPFTRPGAWRPMAANQTNLNASAADPADLITGRAAPDAMGVTAAAAVERLRTDRVRALPDSAIADVTPQSSGINNGGAAAPPANGGQ